MRKPKTPFINKLLSKKEKIQTEVMEDLLLEVAEERDLLEVIFESMVEGVIATDHDGLIIFYNTAAKTLFNFHGEDVLGESFCSLLPEGRLRDCISDAIDSEERVYEAEFKLESPVERILRVNVIPLIDHLKHFFGTVILVIDITDKKVAEARLQLAEKLAARTTLSAGIAHEIRNPLNSLSIHLQLAKKGMNDLSKDAKEGSKGNLSKINKNLKVIRDEVERLDRVVRDFLIAVRPQKPKYSFAPLEPLIHSALNLLEPEFAESNINIVLEPLDEQQLVPMDEDQLRRALINVMRNSIQAMPGGGELRIRLTKLSDRIRIQIVDTGEGISPEILKKIFDPYFTTRADGTGLGLLVVEGIVREHQGRTLVHSEPGKGTCVTIDLPISSEHTKQIPILDVSEFE